MPEHADKGPSHWGGLLHAGRNLNIKTNRADLLSPMMEDRPLHDLLVVETAAVLAGPAVGMFLAELGARVVKVENKRAGGDVTRQWKLPVEDAGAPVSAYFSSVNLGKEHRMLDLKDEHDRLALDDLLTKADVLLTNHLVADAEKLGLDRARLRKLNPRLIHGHITGFRGQPTRPAFDVVMQAETGYISMTGTDGEHLAKLPIALIDVLAAHQLKEGILLAMLLREKQGNGAYVEVSLEEAALTGLVNQASNYLMAGHVARALGTLHPNIAPYGEMFTCADGGGIILAVGSDAQFHGLCAGMGRSEMAVDPRFARNVDRVRNRQVLAAELAPLFAAHPRDPLLRTLIDRGVPAGALLRMNEVMESPAAKAMVAEEEIDGVLTRRIRGNAFRILPL